jgi:predicted phage terminase large subunit-like protein
MELAKRHLLDFMLLDGRGQWQQANHLDILCSKLEAVEQGTLKRLMVFLPPRSGKSEVTSKKFPAWYLGKHPDREIILSSYAADLAYDFSRIARTTLEEWGSLWGVELSEKSSAVNRWGLQGFRGGMMAAGVGGPITGRGAHVALIDDPIKNWQDAQSVVLRERAYNWYKTTLRTRLAPGGAIVLVMCMTGDTPVLMADGTECPLRAIKIGDRVATYDSGKLGTSIVQNHRNNGPNTLYRIRTIGGKNVRANERHPFLVDEGGKLRWMRLRDLTTAHKIVTVKDRRESGKGRSAWSRGVRSPLDAGDIACRTTTKRCGRMGIAPHQTIQGLVETSASNIDTESPPPSTTQWSAHKKVSAPFADSHPEIMCERIGVESYASIIVTKPERSEGSCATTAISQCHTPKPKRTCSRWLNTSDFTTEQIVSIEPAGREDVFDLQIERTENFIANGLVSHNTRWHEDDLAGRIIADMEAGGEQWEIVKLPAYDETIDRYLWEARYPRSEYEATKKALGSHLWSAMYQQEPHPEEGGILKRNWWKFYKAIPKHFDIIIQSWDMTFKDLQTSDYVVGQVWGKEKGDFYLLDQFRARVDMPQTGRALKSLTAKWPKAWQKLVEDTANGPAIIQTLRHEVSGLVPIHPKESKIARAYSVTPLMESGNVYLPDPSICPWIHDFIEECSSFPNGTHDDQVDACAQALRKLGAGTVKVSAKPASW